MRRGFSLVELSIVLVILGLLTGGIMAGQSLIRASELRAVISEYNRYATAMQAFKDKYAQLPGDFNAAETFWGQLSAVDATCMNTVATDVKTCNGDGDGNIEIASTRSREAFAAWHQLANAGLIEGFYTGTYNAAAVWGAVVGTNVPRSRLGLAGWAIIPRSDVLVQGGWYANIFPPNGANWFEFGTTPAGSNGLTGTPALKAEEAWNIDTKLDDGKPGMGNVTVYNATQITNCASSSTASSAIYTVDQSSISCVMFFTL